MKIALIANKKKCSYAQKERVLNALDGLIKSSRTLAEHLQHDLVGISFADNAIQSGFCSEQPDIVIVLGGDGTIISACRYFKREQVPILGVNFGKLGYLATYRYEEFIEHLPQILSNAMFRQTTRRDFVSKRMLLRVMIGAGSNAKCMMAVNDLVVDIGPPFRTTELKVMVDNHELSTIRGDGIIVSTPTGSTAYNLSAGGPIIHPEVDAIVLTPKNPHRLSFRPIVVRACSDIVLRVPSPEGVYASIDGQEVFSLADYDGYMVIDRYRANLEIVERVDYWTTLQEKLNWGR